MSRNRQQNTKEDIPEFPSTKILNINQSVENLPDRQVDYDVEIINDNPKTIFTYNPTIIEKK